MELQYESTLLVRHTSLSYLQVEDGRWHGLNLSQFTRVDGIDDGTCESQLDALAHAVPALMHAVRRHASR